ncbi:MAG: hypothetical protein LW817_04100 [Candidatus Caenarcaniphilales bacterium]|nr:hypothetical protein [Candidatus Caenarcaniphilales bacterium]
MSSVRNSSDPIIKPVIFMFPAAPLSEQLLAVKEKIYAQLLPILENLPSSFTCDFDNSKPEKIILEIKPNTNFYFRGDFTKSVSQIYDVLQTVLEDRCEVAKVTMEQNASNNAKFITIKLQESEEADKFISGRARLTGEYFAKVDPRAVYKEKDLPMLEGFQCLLGKLDKRFFYYSMNHRDKTLKVVALTPKAEDDLFKAIREVQDDLNVDKRLGVIRITKDPFDEGYGCYEISFYNSRNQQVIQKFQQEKWTPDNRFRKEALLEISLQD